jgi:hypothetical protein
MAATALALLSKLGQSVILRRSAAGVYDPAAGLVNAQTDDVTVKGALLNFNLGQTDEAGVLVQANDKKMIMSPGVLPTTKDTVIVQSVEYIVMSVMEINPAGVPVAYSLHLRR